MLFTTALVLAMMSDTATKTTATDSINDENKLICRREPVIGSLVRTTRRCHTRKEWAKLSENARHDIDKIRDLSSTRTSN